MNTDLTSGRGASTGAFLRTCCFFLLIGTLVPVHYFVGLFVKDNALLVPPFFHRSLIKILGVRLRVKGKMTPRNPTLFVSNHSSYIDIPVLGAVVPAHFVAKSEVETWPLFGWLANLQKTVFVERRAVRASAQKDVLRQNLEAGKNLIVFPEGTSTDGRGPLPFKSSLFSTVEAPLPDGERIQVQPISVVCTQIGGLPAGRLWRPYYAWYGDMTLVGHLWNVFKIGSFTVDVIFHDPVDSSSFKSRKDLAQHCWACVAQGVDGLVSGRGGA